MKKGIHPEYKQLKIKIGQDIFETRSACKQNELLMDIDFRNHPAWTGKGVNTVSDTNKNVSAFKKKFAGLNFGIKK